ncbi:MAG: imidazole glycerol phosphate synthase subunit HisH [Deltaproteobacteria bacterium]|nr:imidazole glycerol phosphate synthase subunit HisH [Deltaproteobacteria bacterium]
MLAILDYGAGNQTSVRRALDFVGVPSVVTADPEEIFRSQGLIFPGVGAAGQAMRHLRATGLDRTLADWVAQGRPLLGLCLGCQILLEHSEENDTPTLGLIPGRSRRFDPALREEDGAPIAIPHMGWNALRRRRPSPLFAGIAPEAEFYFVHGYYVEVAPEYELAVTYYGREFCSVLGRDGLWATQFHVEKSGPAGLRLLANFCRYCGERADAE